MRVPDAISRLVPRSIRRTIHTAPHALDSCPILPAGVLSRTGALLTRMPRQLEPQTSGRPSTWSSCGSWQDQSHSHDVTSYRDADAGQGASACHEATRVLFHGRLADVPALDRTSVIVFLGTDDSPPLWNALPQREPVGSARSRKADPGCGFAAAKPPPPRDESRGSTR
jgi:hypothetical protein